MNEIYQIFITQILPITVGILKIVGSLTLFLFGMKIMSDGIQKAAGERLHKIVNYMTTNRFTSVLTGFSITSLIQSSSATTVMVVSFVNIGLLTLVQAIGVIMGANIGTTITGWIVAIFGFKIQLSVIALPLMGLGLPLLFYKKLDKKDLGEAIVGFGILFLGLKYLKDCMPNVNENPQVLEFLANFSNLGFLSFLIFVAVGTVITFIVQSSSAAMAITLTMAYLGWINFPTAAAIVLGENIGTTITAHLASIGTNTNARRAAWAHTVFNMLGVVWMAFFFGAFIKFIDIIVPGPIEIEAGSIASKESITAHLAMFHTLFNIANTVLFIWFVPIIAKFVKKLVPQKEDEASKVYRLKYISTSLQDTPEINIMNAKEELSKMSKIASEMYAKFLQVFNNPDKKLGTIVKEIKEKEEYTDQMQVEISHFLSDCSRENLNAVSANNVNAMIRITNELESIGDSCFNLIILTQKRYDKNIKLDQTAITDIEPYTMLVEKFLKFNQGHLNQHLHKDELNTAFEMENQINTFRNTLKKASQKRLQKGADVKGELLYIDILRHIERIGDYSLNIAQALRQIH